MKNKFSKYWKRSKRPGKQRKYLAKAPLHIKRKFLSVTLSKELRKKYGKRNLVPKKGDVVEIMNGKFKKKQGKINEIKIKRQKIYVDGLQIKKQDGSTANVPVRPANLQIVELNLDDKKRLKNKKIEIKQPKMENKNAP